MAMHTESWRGLVEPLESRRLLSAGDMDLTFGSAGFSYFGDSFPARSVAVQPGGKVIVAEDHGFVERFNPDGTRDLGFGPDGNGMISVSFDIVGMAIDPQGRIVLGGNNAGGTDWIVARLNADGSPDGTFNGIDPDSGTAYSQRYVPPSTLIGTRQGTGWFALQGDGKVLLGGYFSGGETDSTSTNYGGQTGSNVELIRLNGDGTPDMSFGDRGEAITRNGDWTSYGSGRALLVRPNGEVVIAGLVHPAIEGATGFEATFSPGGDLLSDRYAGTGPYTDSLVGVIRPDGKVIVGTEQVLGYRQTLLDIAGQNVGFAFNTPFARNWPGPSGTAANFGTIDAALATQDSKVLLATGGGDQIALARVDASGAPDLTFGFGGTTILDPDLYHDGWTGTQSATALAQTVDGDILVAGDFRGHLFISRIRGGSHAVGQQAPRVSVVPLYVDPVADTSHDPLRVSVHFFGDNPIDASTIDEGDFVVTGPGGYTAPGTFTIVESPGADRLPADVLFDFAMPAAGTFADGTYTVHLVGQVLDTAGRAVAAGVVGSFALPVGLPANPAPDAAPFVADLLSPYGPEAGQHFMNFRVRLHSLAGIDLSTLDDTNFDVSRGDGISARAEFVSAQTLDDGVTVIATYRVGAPRGGNWDDDIAGPYRFNYPAEGQFDIHLRASPRDKAGHTASWYSGPEFYDSIDGNFTSREDLTQPTATLAGIDAPVGDGPVTFRVRYTPGPYATINLSSIQDQAVWVDPADAPRYFDPDWAHLDRADVAADGSVVATYSVVGSGGSGLFGIHVGSTSGYLGADRSPRDSGDTAVPNGLLGTFDMGYARRRPSVTLLTEGAAASPRRYVTIRVAYRSFDGVSEASLDGGDLTVMAASGVRMRARFAGAESAAGEPSLTVASYVVRLPPGVTGDEVLHVVMGARQVRDVQMRGVSGGDVGMVRVVGLPGVMGPVGGLVRPAAPAAVWGGRRRERAAWLETIV